MHTGVLFMGTNGSKEFDEFRATETGDVEILKAKQIQARWPELKVGNRDNLVGIYDMKGGVVLAEKSLKVFKEQAIKAGASLHYNTKVVTMDKGGSEIHTLKLADGSTIRAKHVVASCGS